MKEHRILSQNPKFQDIRFSRSREIPITLRHVRIDDNNFRRFGHFLLRSSVNLEKSARANAILLAEYLEYEEKKERKREEKENEKKKRK